MRKRGITLPLAQSMVMPMTASLLWPGDEPAPPPEANVVTFFNHATENGGAAAADSSAYTMGTVFRVEDDGTIGKVYFWKPSTNVETGRSFGIWDEASKVLLWSGTTTGEAAGPVWIECVVDPPLAVNQFDTVVIGCTTNKYSAAAGYFPSEIRRPGISAPVYDGNSRFNVGAGLVFPEQVFGTPNYWVDFQLTYFETPPPTPQGVPNPIAIPAGYPSALNTGPTGVLTPASYVRSSANNQIIENLDIFGGVYVTHDNVTIRNCRIISNTPYHVIHLDLNSNPDLTMTVEDCEIDGMNISVNGILGAGLFQRNNIHGIQNGINSGDATIIDNYIHALGATGGEPHYDGVECNGAPNGMTISHNTIFVVQPQTAAIMLNNQFGGINNVTVNDNLIAGGGYTVYVDNTKSASPVDGATILITNNKMLPGLFGYFATYTSNPVISGNTNASTGSPVS